MSKKVMVFALVCCLMSAFVVSAPVAAQEPRPLIIDTDMTSDDFMAMLYIFNNPAFAVKAITVTGTGFSYCDAGVEAALGLLALADYGDVPVSCWKDTPLMGGENPVPPDWRTSLETVKALGLPAGGKAVDVDAVQLFTDTVTAADSAIEVLALGPLTNIAEAFNKTPVLVEKIKRITIMGGAVDVAGSSVTDDNTSAEWNIFCDPPAARIVFESGAPITLVGLDATDDAPVTPAFVDRLKADQKTPEAKLVAMLLNNSAESISSGGYFFWDPLAAVVLANPDIVTLQERDVTVIDVPGAEYGRTKPVGNGSRISVASKPDSAALETSLIDAWNAGA